MVSLWEYRGLIKKMAITDLKIRYKNSVLGFLWSLLQPMAMLIVLYVVFSNLFRNNTIAQYPIYLMIGVVLWNFFCNSTSLSLNSIVGKGGLIKKIYFPREVLVISACLTALMMTMIEFVVVGLFMIVLLVVPTETILILPLLLLLEFAVVLGISLVIASLNVKYRDIQWIWGVAIQVGFFLTPIMYSLSIFDGTSYGQLIRLNPIGLMMDMCRQVLIYDTIPSLSDIAIVIGMAIALLVIGGLIFKWLEPDFAEEV